jgi:hypothetical protein
MENETVSIWNKTQDEVTVKDTVIISAATMVVAVAAPLVIMAAVGGAVNLYQKIRGHKKVELEVVETEV